MKQLFAILKSPPITGQGKWREFKSKYVLIIKELNLI